MMIINKYGDSDSKIDIVLNKNKNDDYEDYKVALIIKN